MSTGKHHIIQRPWVIKSLFAILFFGLLLWLWVPKPLFNVPYASVLYSADGQLLAATIAADEQWRFPESDSVPMKFKEAILMFEDEYFYYHPGINPFSVARAMAQNIKAGRIKSGGSTISMQLIRLSEKRKGKSWWDKISESLKALGLELQYSKSAILNLYAAHAPFGGNVVGLEAAAWRYYGKNASELTWAEAATLAVLPNSPSLIFPGKNSKLLLEKRNALLRKLHAKGKFDDLDLQLALEEPLPGKPHPLPQHAVHLLNRAKKDFPGLNLFYSTININLQKKVEYILKQEAEHRKSNGVHHAAIIVLNVRTGQVEAYAGNSEYHNDDRGAMIDMAMVPRSTGSILKPLLYAASLQEGKILPQSLIPDIPTQIGGYVPKNYSLTFDGAVPAHKALSRSLNIPSVRMLNEFGVGKFHNLLHQAGMSTLTRPPMHYGLSLILGGAEGRLDEICMIYTNLARTLHHVQSKSAERPAWMKKLPYLQQFQHDAKQIYSEGNLLSPAVIYEMFQAMLLASRPDEEAWRHAYRSGRKVSWKTGTSFGQRDAWSIGVSPNYVVGVWVGNANGASSALLTGIGAAAPLMFDVFSHLPMAPWFVKPDDDYQTVKVCLKSGYVAGLNCGDAAVYQQVPRVERNRSTCPYHQTIFIDRQTGHRVNAACAEPANMQAKSWFILPTAIEFYYRQKHADYLPLPPLKADCKIPDDFKSLEVIYPRDLTKIFLPRNWRGEKSCVVFEAAHRDPQARIFWNLDGKFIGQTLQMHRISMQPEPGEHVLSLIDSYGNKITRRIIIYEGE